MSSEQPDNDPLHKRPSGQEPSAQEWPSQEPGGSHTTPGTSSSGQASPGGDSPYGPPPPPGAAGGPGGSYGRSPYDSGPYNGSPYADQYGGAGSAPDPLAGMAPLASRGRRLLARIVDALIVGIPIGIISAAIAGFTYDGDGMVAGTGYWQGAFYTLVYFLYEGLLLSRSGQTLGKRLLRVRVAMLHNGAVPSGAPAWLRAAIYQIPALVPCLGTLFWLVNVLFCTWDKPYQQCLHDKGAKTVVVAVD